MNTSNAWAGPDDVPPALALQRGDHIRAGWPGHAHHDGIYLGDGLVIHMTGGPDGGKAGAYVQIGTLAIFAAGRPVTVRPYAGNRDPEATIARARSCLGTSGYNLVFNNCQHFARWCVTGDRVSEQVEAVAAAAGTIATPVLAASLGGTVVGSAGLVAGLSGPGIMSGLAQWGAIVGGGAVAGLVLLGALPGLATVAITTTALRDDEDLPDAERAARTAGRVGSVSGAVVGSMATVAAVKAVGVPGLSAVGISSGLAGIGRMLGGGMAKGTICAIAVPAVTAAIIGYTLYKVVLRLQQSNPAPAPADAP
jgi:Lecithin retinol acyltransferase